MILVDQSAERPSNIKRTLKFNFSESVGGLSCCTGGMPVVEASLFAQLQCEPQAAVGLLGLGLANFPTTKFQPQTVSGASHFPDNIRPKPYSTRSGRPLPKARDVAGQRRPARQVNRSSRLVGSGAHRSGLVKFVQLSASRSPYEKEDCSWYDVSVIHIGDRYYYS